MSSLGAVAKIRRVSSTTGPRVSSQVSRRRRCVGRGAPGGGPRVRRGPRRPRRADRRRHACLCRRARPRCHPRPRRAGRRGADVLCRAGDAPGTAGRWPNGWSRPAGRWAPKRLPRAPPSTRTSRASWPTSRRSPTCRDFPRAVARTLSELQLAGVDAAALAARARRRRRPGHAAGRAASRGRSRPARSTAPRCDRHRRAAAAGPIPTRCRRAPCCCSTCRWSPPPRAACSTPCVVAASDADRHRAARRPCHSRRPRAMRRGRRRRRSEPATDRRSGDRARSPAQVALRLRHAAGGRRRRHGARVLGAGRGPRSRRDRRAACCGRRRAACRSTRWRCCCARRRPTSACSSTPSPAPACRRGSSAAPAAPIPPAAPSWRCSPAPTRACRRAASPSICRSPRCRIWRGTGPDGTKLPAAVRRFRPTTQFLPRCPPTRSPRTRRRSTRRRRPTERDADDRVVAGTLRAPWRWEELLVEAYVIEGLDRWQRRLPGLRAEYERRLRRARRRGPGLAAPARAGPRPRRAAAPRVVRAADRRRARQLARAPAAGASGSTAFEALVPRVLRQPARVLRVLAEMAPLGSVGPVTLREVRDVLAPRLLTTDARTAAPASWPGVRRHAARRRAAARFRVVFVPGLAERIFPQRLREDALLLDARRAELARAAGRRRHPGRRRTAAAAPGRRRRHRAHLPVVSARSSWPSRGRACRRSTCSTCCAPPPAASRATRPLSDLAFANGRASLAWPAPPSPERRHRRPRARPGGAAAAAARAGDRTVASRRPRPLPARAQPVAAPLDARALVRAGSRRSHRPTASTASST